jgi:hypothetical protein
LTRPEVKAREKIGKSLKSLLRRRLRTMEIIVKIEA